MKNKILSAYIIALLFIVLACATAASASQSVLKPVSENIFTDTRNGKHWQMEKSKRFKTVSQVNEYLDLLNQGEHSDWRLPTREELAKLFTAFDLKESGDVRIQLEGNYWVADEQIQAGAWAIGDQCGPSRTFYTKKAGNVRAIRP